MTTNRTELYVPLEVWNSIKNKWTTTLANNMDEFYKQ